MVFIGVFVGFCMATLSLAAYAYFLFAFGRSLGSHPWVRHRLTLTLSIIAIIATGLGCLGLLAPVHVVYKLVLALGVTLLHAHPVAIGVWTGRALARDADAKLFEARTNEWLSAWEPHDEPGVPDE
jgi:hypothetical protein